MPSVPINTAASGLTHLVAAPSATSFIRVLGYVLMAGGTTNVNLQDTAAVALTGPLPLTAQAGAVAPVAPQQGWFDLAPGVGLDLNNTAAVQVSGHVSYCVKP